MSRGREISRHTWVYFMCLFTFVSISHSFIPGLCRSWFYAMSANWVSPQEFSLQSSVASCMPHRYGLPRRSHPSRSNQPISPCRIPESGEIVEQLGSRAPAVTRGMYADFHNKPSIAYLRHPVDDIYICQNLVHLNLRQLLLVLRSPPLPPPCYSPPFYMEWIVLSPMKWYFKLWTCLPTEDLPVKVILIRTSVAQGFRVKPL